MSNLFLKTAAGVYILGMIVSVFGFFNIAPMLTVDAQWIFFVVMGIALIFLILDLQNRSKKVNLIQEFAWLYYVFLFFIFANISAGIAFYMLPGTVGNIATGFFYLLMFMMAFSIFQGVNLRKNVLKQKGREQ